MRFTVSLICLVAFTSQGCAVIHSREPLYDRTKESTFNDGLAGTWSNEDMRWTIKRGEPNGAILTLESLKEEREGNHSMTVPADFIQIGSWRYVFLRDPEATSLHGVNATAHTLPQYRIKRDWSDLRVSLLDTDELARRLDVGTAPFYHENQPPVTQVADDGTPYRTLRTVTISGSAEHIREFLKRHEDDRKLFLGDLILNRESR